MKIYKSLSNSFLFQIVLYLRVFCFILIFVCNALMWTLFVKSLQMCNSSIEATITNTSSNLIFTVSVYMYLFMYSVSNIFWPKSCWMCSQFRCSVNVFQQDNLFFVVVFFFFCIKYIHALIDLFHRYVLAGCVWKSTVWRIAVASVVLWSSISDSWTCTGSHRLSTGGQGESVLT